ncbi:aromatic acid exporter family protein [Aeromicrobium sp. CTD01-1L150]|uniref:FUSC family protein n=1 Tax=Aeromicrobium sp. CTD01-1L150 TaxID=3341830 RepID=UPI0035C00604
MDGREVPLRRIRLRPSGETARDRIIHVRRRWRMLVRLAVAPSVAFLVATEIFGHQQAFFAPVAAILVITAGAGLRGRTLAEIVVGVAVGVLVGELIILTIGRGTLQLAAVVVLSVIVATLLGIKGMALTQAANSAVLLTAVVPAFDAGNPAVTRFIDALIGGLCGMAMVLLLPRNPVRDIDSEVQRLLRQLASVLRGTARAMREADAEAAEAALARARSLQPGIDDLEATAQNVSEIARMSPMRWRQRAHLGRYLGAVQDFDNAIRDARVLARRTAAMLRHGEACPTDLELATEALADAVDIIADDLSQDDDFDEARQKLVDAARIAVLALPGAMTLNTASIAAQVRSLAADLLYASGSTRDEIDERLDFD